MATPCLSVRANQSHRHVVVGKKMLFSDVFRQARFLSSQVCLHKGVWAGKLHENKGVLDQKAHFCLQEFTWFLLLQLSSSRLWGQLLAWHLVQVYLRESSNRITEKKNIENAMYERKVISSNIPHHQWSPALPCWSPCASLWGSPVSPPGNDNLIGSHALQRVEYKLKIRTLKKCNHLQVTRAPVAVHHCVWFWGILISTPGLMLKYWRRRYK